MKPESLPGQAGIGPARIGFSEDDNNDDETAQARRLERALWALANGGGSTVAAGVDASHGDDINGNRSYCSSGFHLLNNIPFLSSRTVVYRDRRLGLSRLYSIRVQRYG